ncbi:hypothetical protein C8J56DRAFT_8032 [Mycena floridula]|nr:hypothetical protein C8J56DRAFT_8032 [Mycena floridula]
MHEEFDVGDGDGLGTREIHECWSQVLHNGPSALIWPWMPTRLLAYMDLLGTTLYLWLSSPALTLSSSSSSLPPSFTLILSTCILQTTPSVRPQATKTPSPKPKRGEYTKVLFYRDAMSLNKFCLDAITQGAPIGCIFGRLFGSSLPSQRFFPSIIELHVTNRLL